MQAAGTTGLLLLLASSFAAAQSGCPVAPPAIDSSRLTVLCAAQPVSSALACTLQRQCARTSSSSSPPIFPSLCNTTRLASVLCADDVAVAGTIPECSSLRSQLSTVQSTSSGCKQALGLFSFTSTNAVRQAALSACDDMAGTPMAGCSACSSASACPDPLGAFAAGCVDMRMQQCATAGWTSFCTDPTQAGVGGFGMAAATLCLKVSQYGTVKAPPAPPPALVAMQPLAMQPSASVPASPPASPPLGGPPPSSTVSASASPPAGSATRIDGASMTSPAASPLSSPSTTPMPSTAVSPMVSPTSISSPAASPAAGAVGGTPPSSVASPSVVPSTADGTGSSLYSVDACIADPTQPMCAAYEYPTANISADIAKLCTSMPDMPGCSLQAACMAGNVPIMSSVCSPMTLLATLCTDMPGMSGCATWKKLCVTPGSAVQQCSAFPAIPSTPSWSYTTDAVQSICTEMSMTECSSCTTASCPDPLSSLAGLCTSMPTMSQCSGFATWCASSNAGAALDYYCSSGGAQGSGLPSMLMYFHERISEVVLWKGWLPHTPGQYAGTIICVLVFGVVSVALKTGVTILGIAWQPRLVAAAASQGYDGWPWWLPNQAQVVFATAKAVLLSIAITLDYFNMLVAMTFNVGLFCAVVLGYVLGTFLLSHLPDNFVRHLCQKNNMRLNSPSGSDSPDEGAGQHQLSGVPEKLEKYKAMEEGRQPVAESSSAGPGGYACAVSCCPSDM